MKGKKGQIEASKAVKYAIAIVIIGLGGTLFSLAIADNERIGSTPNQRVVEVIGQHRLFYSPDCFAYVDPLTQRAYPGIIDLEKFTEARLQSCYATLDDAAQPCFAATIETNRRTIGPIYTKNYASCALRHHMVDRPNYMHIQDGAQRIDGTVKLRYPRP